MLSETSSTPVNPSEPSTPTLQEIVQKFLPTVRWLSTDKGLATCPGHSKHTSRSTKRDCAVFIGGNVPTVTCFHSNCYEEIAKVNEEIRDVWRLYQPELPEADKARLRAEHSRRHELESRALAAKSRILVDYRWNINFDEPSTPAEQFARWKSLWKPTDRIWIGEPHESGQWFHRDCFPTVDEASCRGHFSSASTYKEGTCSRANDMVLATPYLIVEGDAVLGKPNSDTERRENKLACAAIFRWLEKEVGMTLRCVIDSGNKSLHGWFDMPNTNLFEELKVLLPALGCDKSMFKPSQPARIPGIRRENGNMQTMLYFK